MLLGDCKIPVTTHTTPVVIHDIALQLRLHFFVSTLGSTHQFWGYLKRGKRDKSAVVSKTKETKTKTKSHICGQTAQMVVDKIITKLLGRTSERP